MENENSVIFDAAARFAEKQKEAEQQARIMELPEELQWVSFHISQQPARFFGYLASCSEQVANELQADFGTGMRAALILEKGDASEEHTSSGVYYRENGEGVKEPYLLITNHDVTEMVQLLKPLLTEETGKDDKPKNIEVATAAVCWLYLGAWAFDRLDPRRQGEIDESPEAYAFWAELTDLSVDDDMNDPEIRKRIQDQAEVNKWRIAGRSAYEGILQTEQVNEVELKAFQRMYFAPYFTRQVELNPATIRPEHFALANPFEHDGIKQLLGRLGLVQ